MAREGRDVWAKRVQRWRESDLTANEFATEVGVNVNTLRSWAWRLRGSSSSKPSQLRAATFVEVTPALLGAAPMLELVVSERFVVRVPVGFDAATLRELVATLEATA